LTPLASVETTVELDSSAHAPSGSSNAAAVIAQNFISFSMFEFQRRFAAICGSTTMLREEQ
jgi:hypothetical protein